jgi:FkbM family methyltransferase
MLDYLKNPWTPFKFDHQFIKLPVAKGMTYNLFALHPDWMTSLFKKLAGFQNEDEYFFDIGANLGQTLINFSTVFKDKKYVGFEPDSYCIVYLKKLIELNNFANSLIVPVGLSEQNKLLPLYSSSHTDSGATFRENLRPDRELFSAVVPTFKLDDVVQNLNFKSVSLLKIDVEGWELEVFKGMSNILQIDRPIIICEIIFRDSKASPEEHKQRNKQLLNILNKFNYRIFQLLKTSDLKDIQSMRKIEEFSEEIWTQDNKHLCDYLFIPEEKQENILQIYSAV